MRLSPVASRGLRTRAWLLALALLAGARSAPCQAPRVAPAPPRAYAFLAEGSIREGSIERVRSGIPYSSITLKREACFGTCPVYTVTLFRDGHATYTGTRFVPRIGRHRGEVQIWDFARLAYFFDQQRIDTLAGNYEAAWTDAPTATVIFTRADGSTITVEDYGEVGPISVWGLREAIDAVTQRIVWSADSTR